MRIESKVARGAHKGDVQTPWRDAEGFFIASHHKFMESYLRLADERSVANALASGLRVRMNAASQTAAGLVEPESITIDGLSIADWRRHNWPNS